MDARASARLVPISSPTRRSRDNSLGHRSSSSAAAAIIPASVTLAGASPCREFNPRGPRSAPVTAG